MNNKAVSNIEKERDIYITKGTTASTIKKNHLNKKFDHKQTVRNIVLDNYIKKHSNPTFIEVDVEGAESEVIEGGSSLFESNFPVVSLEVSSGSEDSESVRMLRDNGYKTYFLTKKGEIQRIRGNLVIKTRESQFVIENFIFIK